MDKSLRGRSFDLRQLEYFCAVARSGSFTKAAEEVGVAQSSLSEQIAKVSSDTGNALASLRSIVDALTENLTSASAESGRIAQLIEERYLTFELRLDAAETRADSARTAQTETLQNALLALTHRFDEAEKRFHETLNGLKTSLAEAAKRSDPARAETSADTRPASPQPHPIRETVLPATSVSTRSADYLAQTRRAAKPVSQVAPDGTKPNASTVAQGGMRRATKPAALAITVFLLAAAGILTHHYITRPVGPSASSPRGQAIAQSVEPSSSALNRLLAKAEADDASAQFLLGVQLLQKGNPAANASEAAAWLHKAAGSGLAIAQYRLAVLYEKGHGVPRDSDQAAAWYLSAAKLGNRLAMHNLGVAYANGNGVRQSYEDAAHWFQAAADLGLVASQFNLGVLYERGFGVPASLEEAYEWYAIAAANGDADSQARLSVLAAQLRPADRIAAERNAKTFKTHPLVPAANEAPALRQIAS